MAVGQEKMGFITVLTIVPVSFKIRPDCGMSRAVTRKSTPRPLDTNSLNDLALHYVGRFATSRARLIQYLGRKIRERGWADDGAPDAEAVADRLVGYGYVDDVAYAEMKTRGLLRRGYGARRVDDALRAAGIGEAHRAERRDAVDDTQRKEEALRYAQRRRFGPYSAQLVTDPKDKQRIFAAFLRAGHDVATARAIMALAPGADVGEWLDQTEYP